MHPTVVTHKERVHTQAPGVCLGGIAAEKDELLGKHLGVRARIGENRDRSDTARARPTGRRIDQVVNMPDHRDRRWRRVRR